MTTHLLSVIEHQQKALKHAIKWLNICDKPRECMPLHDALAAGQQALEQTQVESAPLSHLKTETGAPPEQGAITSVNGSEPAPNPLDALTKTCEGLGLYEADFEPAPSTAGEAAMPVGELTDGPAGSGGWKLHAEAMEKERDYYRQRAQTMYEHQCGQVWYWQGDGCDHLESMVNSLPVVIRADALRAILAAARSQPTTEESSVVAGAQPVREPLTNKQISQILEDPNIAEKHQGNWLVLPYSYARAIEAAHGITKKGEE